MQKQELQEKLGQETKYSKYYLLIIEKAKAENRKKLKKDNLNYIYYENHHILPKSIFPEYKDLKYNPWNGILLTAKEHFICHALIWKHYKKLELKKQELQMATAFQCLRYMSNGEKINSSLYQYFKHKLSGLHLEKNKGTNNFNHTSIKIYDNNNQLRYTFDKNSNLDSFKEFCKYYNLPHSAFCTSYRNNGKPILSTENAIAQLKNKEHSKFILWYALRGDENRDLKYNKIEDITTGKKEIIFYIYNNKHELVDTLTNIKIKQYYPNSFYELKSYKPFRQSKTGVSVSYTNNLEKLIGWYIVRQDELVIGYKPYIKYSYENTEHFNSIKFTDTFNSSFIIHLNELEDFCKKYNVDKNIFIKRLHANINIMYDTLNGQRQVKDTPAEYFINWKIEKYYIENKEQYANK